MHISDALSRLSDHNTERGNAQEIKGFNIQICEVSPVQFNLTINQIQAETAKDPDMCHGNYFLLFTFLHP